MTAFVALLRAVNVGGTGKLPMSELKAMCEALDYGHVKTYIASGNVVFTSRKSETAVKAALEKQLEAYAGKPVGVFVRTATELAGVLTENPFPKKPPNQTLAVFLDKAPPSNALRDARGQKRRRNHPGTPRNLYLLRRRNGKVETRHSCGQNRHSAQHEYYCDARQNGC